ncbi:hypothetical protein KKI90_10175 [Xenorhabdus bovienii]|nr:hypothetical protein [Xenorhabdus bovienii]MDE1477595.1 hypothetical protein [Xenorhabdus bovienii]MDE1486751.1 hypothetical protein [Xenorhabdus bovienii]MDE9477303.1 hypothetical protein [Xenorhabdus bovienii]MDE9509336.1 hypothetical protein [Xenorhabdus bovienii]MDE9520981.1 hypothetical protein [Xenorhabdus bovienii]
MTIKVSQLNPIDLLSLIAHVLESAQRLSAIESGSQLAYELFDFAQQAAQEASNLENIN